MLDIHLQRDQGDPLILEGPGQAVNLLLVQEELPVTQRVLIEVGPVVVLTDVNIHQPGLPVLDLGKPVLEVDPVSPDRFDLGPGQHQPRLISVRYKIVVTGLFILGNQVIV